MHWKSDKDTWRCALHGPCTLGNEAELHLEPLVSVMSRARDWSSAFTGQVLVPATPGWAQRPVTVPQEHSYTWLLPVLQTGLFLGVSCPKRVTRCTTFTRASLPGAAPRLQAENTALSVPARRRREARVEIKSMLAVKNSGGRIYSLYLVLGANSAIQVRQAHTRLLLRLHRS